MHCCEALAVPVGLDEVARKAAVHEPRHLIRRCEPANPTEPSEDASTGMDNPPKPTGLSNTGKYGTDTANKGLDGREQANRHSTAIVKATRKNM